MARRGSQGVSSLPSSLFGGCSILSFLPSTGLRPNKARKLLTSKRSYDERSASSTTHSEPRFLLWAPKTKEVIGMRFLTGFLLALTVTSIGCNTNQREGRQAGPSKEQAVSHVETSTADAQRPLPAGEGNASKGALPALESAGGGGGGGGRAVGGGGGGTLRRSMADDASAVSLASIGTVYAATEAVERKDHSQRGAHSRNRIANRRPSQDHRSRRIARWIRSHVGVQT